MAWIDTLAWAKTQLSWQIDDLRAAEQDANDHAARLPDALDGPVTPSLQSEGWGWAAKVAAAESAVWYWMSDIQDEIDELEAAAAE